MPDPLSNAIIPMRRPGYSDDQLILAARLYFLDGLPQAQIGKLVNVSQSKVSRMLALARERGLVRVTVPEYEPRNRALEDELKAVLGVEAVVVRAIAGLRIEDLRQTIGYFAAPVLATWMEGARVVAVTGGRTMQALVEQMKPPAPTRGVVLVQAMGNIDSTHGQYDAAELGRILARRWHGTFLSLNTPALLPNAATRKQLLALEQIQQVLAQLVKADLVFAGIGTLENSVFVERNSLGASTINKLRAAGAVGELLGRFFDARGRECATPFRNRVVSLSLEDLKRIPRRVGVLAGADRAEAVHAAVRGGLLNALALGEEGATALLARAQSGRSGSKKVSSAS